MDLAGWLSWLFGDLAVLAMGCETLTMSFGEAFLKKNTHTLVFETLRIFEPNWICFCGLVWGLFTILVMTHAILYLHVSALMTLVVFVVQRYNSAVCGFQKGV